jgi:hypothetical protein
LLVPHNDDEVLYASYTIMHERPLVFVMFDSYVQPARGIAGCDAATRRQETWAGLRQLAAGDWPVNVMFGCLRDDQRYEPPDLVAILKRSKLAAEKVWAPAFEANGHRQHNLLGQAADLAFPGRVTHYLTYTPVGKSRGGMEVLPRSGEEIARKLRALACYTSQLQIYPRLGCWPHFVGDQREYVL